MILQCGVCQSVCHVPAHCKSSWNEFTSCLVWKLLGPKEHCIRWGSWSPWRGKGIQCGQCRVTLATGSVSVLVPVVSAGWVIRPVKIVPKMTCKVSSGTLILYTLTPSTTVSEALYGLADCTTRDSGICTSYVQNSWYNCALYSQYGRKTVLIIFRHILQVVIVTQVYMEIGWTYSVNSLPALTICCKES